MLLTRRDMLGMVTGALAGTLVNPQTLLGAALVKPLPHPDPRPGITGEHVLSHDQLGKRKDTVYDAYDFARTYPEIFDGIYCICHCDKGKAGHRSLLACYESTQPTGCGTCQEEGEFVGKLAAEGKSLGEIRSAVDKEYG